MEEPQEHNQNTPETTTPQGGEEQISVGTKHKNLWAVIAYFIFFIPLLTDKKDDPYVKFHVKQGLVLLISFVVQAAISMVPIIGWIIAFVLWILNIVLLIIGVFNAISGKQKELPLIGKLASHLKF